MNNEFTVNPFEATKTSTAIVSVWKSTEARMKEQGVLYLGSTKTGHKSILSKFVSGTNLQYKGKPIDPAKIVDANVNVRVSPEQAEELIDIITDMPNRLFEMALKVTDISLKVLTSNGVPTRNITFFAEIVDVREVQAALVGDDFDTQDALDAFLTGAQNEARQDLDDYRTLMNAVRDGAPVEGEAEPANAMG